MFANKRNYIYNSFIIKLKSDINTNILSIGGVFLMCVMWDYFRYMETEPTARKYLAESYSVLHLENPERLAFQQSTRFLYSFKQARTYYETAAQSELLIRPLLLFYGCAHLLKGLCIAKDPYYPQNSRVLQHGVTTRKIKKTPYHLLDDEVRPQKEGLFSFIANLLQLHPLADKYKIGQLFSYLPELCTDYALTVQNSPWCEILFSNDDKTIYLPHQSHGSLAYSNDTFLHYLNRLSPEGIIFENSTETNGKDKKEIRVILKNRDELIHHPLFANTADLRWYFWNDSINQEDLPLPGWAVHFLLLYILGMLCRYETEYWGDLVLSHSYAEIILVEQFLKLHQNQFPKLLHELLTHRNLRVAKPVASEDHSYS